MGVGRYEFRRMKASANSAMRKKKGWKVVVLEDIKALPGDP
jgi:hypothetical protein